MISEVQGLGDAIGWHPANMNSDMFKAIKELLGSAGTNLEEMMARTRLDDDQRSAIVIQCQKALAIEGLKLREKKNHQVPIATQFPFEKMSAALRGVYLRGITEIPGDGDARFEITSALTGGLFARGGAAAKGMLSGLRGMGRRRAQQEKLSQ
jgi:hypothetical protein